ncbi:hypothetical protein ACCO45_005030 [Purpureocillium lilacinum]|uniref:Uncharacterized protein n=1 Tax=Purpureocillium lilacinum TaxID=33203 RepID=A0ACC4DV78_PURLI
MPESILRGYCSPPHSLHSRPGGLLAPVTPHPSVITFFPPSYPTLPTYPCSPTTCHCQLALLRSAPVRYTVPVAPLGRHPPSRHHRPRALIGRRSSPTRAANGAPCRCRRTPCQGMPLPNAVLQIAVEVPHCHPPDVAAGAAAPERFMAPQPRHARVLDLVRDRRGPVRRCRLTLHLDSCPASELATTVAMSRSAAIPDVKCAPSRRGNLTVGVADRNPCIAACRRRLLLAVWSRNETLQESCQALSSDTANASEAFRAAYRCDFQFCGVQNCAGRGQDRGLGHYSLVDPGPPTAISSSESTPANEKGPHPCGRRLLPTLSKSQGPYTQRLLKRSLGHDKGKNSPGMAGLQPASGSISTASSASSAITGVPIRDPSLAASLRSPDIIIAASQVRRDRGLSTGAKITIALSAAVVLFVIAALALVWYLRFRRQARRARLHGDSSSSKEDQSRIGTHGSPMPLLSPTPKLPNPSESPLRPPRAAARPQIPYSGRQLATHRYGPISTRRRRRR